MRARSNACWLTICAIAASGCVAENADRVRVERSDSAGVEIVRNAGADVPLDRSFEPALALGGADAGPASFYRLWSTGIAAGPTGDLFVLDPTAHRVVVFDSTGRHLRTVGREGGGPGEFRMPLALTVDPEGRLAVYDSPRRALLWFGPDGAILEQQRFEVGFHGGYLHAAGAGLVVPVWTRDYEREVRVHRLLRIQADDTTTLVELEQPLVRTIRYESCGMSISLPPLFAGDLTWRAGGDRIAVIRSPEYVVDIYRYGDDTPVRSVRRDIEPRAVTDAMARAEVGDGETWRFPGGSCTVPADEVAEKRGYAELMPTVVDVALTPAGGLRVQRRTVGDAPRPIDVFSRDGAYEGTLPEGAPWPVTFLPDGRPIAIETDSLGVQRLVVYGVSEGSLTAEE